MATFDPNIFLRGAQLNAAQNQQLLDTFGMLTQGYIKAKQLEGARMDKARMEAEKQAQDPMFIAGQLRSGANVTPEQENILKTYLAMKADYGIHPVTGAMVQTSPTFENVLGMRTEQAAPIGAATQAAAPAAAQTAPEPPSPIQGQPLQATEQSDFQEATAGISGGGLEKSPKFQMMKMEKELDFQSKRLLENIKDGKAQALTDRQKEAAQFVIDRMNKINEKLAERGGIVKSTGGATENIGAYLQSTGAGQEVSKVADPETQALRDEYRKLQSTFLPFYATAAGLGAKSLDSEGERKSILDSFGDPSGIFESNKQQLKNLSELIGTGSKGDGQSGKPVVTTQEEYDALPSGAVFIEDGVEYRKP